jgi:glyoxylase-like metal-dependent hydrolase (beta-lactamase superfamily II)
MGQQLMHNKERNDLYFEVAQNVWGTKDIFVNMYIVRNPEENTWVLIDTGLKSSAAKIKKMAELLFSPESKPEAILLTHGHFDHVGSMMQLAAEWDVNVYCHYLELPYLSGKSSYPPPDPSVGGGLMTSASWLYPKNPINAEGFLQILPPDGSVPFLPDWKYIYTPGHAPGHVSFFRERDRVLISGDAVVTTKAESAMSVVVSEKKVLSGPPKYFTYDWTAAEISVRNIADLEPRIIAAGHGKPMSGRELQVQLVNLALHFKEMAVPDHGRYIDDPAVADATGVRYVPPKAKTYTAILTIAGLALAVAATTWILLSRKKRTV